MSYERHQPVQLNEQKVKNDIYLYYEKNYQTVNLESVDKRNKQTNK